VAARLSVKLGVIKRDGQKIKVSGTTYCLDAGFSEISVDVFGQLDASRLFDSTLKRRQTELMKNLDLLR